MSASTARRAAATFHPVGARHVYVHVPFCARRCSYCDFAIAVRRAVPSDDFVQAIGREIELRYPDGSDDVETIYLGGGTPSRLAPAALSRLLDVVGSRWSPVPGAEITLEANPEDVDLPTARAWRRAGFTRVSLGVQSFDDRVLRWMHRTHDSARIPRAVDDLRTAGFESWSLDLIYALPATLERSWSCDLDQALALAPPHISCYGLTVEPHTPLDRWRARGQLHEAGEDAFEREFLQADETLVEAGLEHYEVSNFARPGFRSRHNSAYWERVPYVGLGPSAHSFDGSVRRWSEREYAEWLRNASAGLDPVSGTETLSADQEAIERLYLGLRTTLGVEVSDSDRPFLSNWCGEQWARMEGDRVFLRPAGWLRLDAIVAALTDFRSR